MRAISRRYLTLTAAALAAAQASSGVKAESERPLMVELGYLN